LGSASSIAGLESRATCSTVMPTTTISARLATPRISRPEPGRGGRQQRSGEGDDHRHQCGSEQRRLQQAPRSKVRVRQVEGSGSDGMSPMCGLPPPFARLTHAQSFCPSFGRKMSGG
jgi:hypothetical protein